MIRGYHYFRKHPYRFYPPTHLSQHWPNRIQPWQLVSFSPHSCGCVRYSPSVVVILGFFRLHITQKFLPQKWCVGKNKRYTRWLKVTFSSPSWRSLNLSKRSRKLTIPKRWQTRRIAGSKTCQVFGPLDFGKVWTPHVRPLTMCHRCWSGINWAAWDKPSWFHEILSGIFPDPYLKKLAEGNNPHIIG